MAGECADHDPPPTTPGRSEAQRVDGNPSQYADGWRMALEEICVHIGQDIERIIQGDKA
jgi:hypothetical protein